MPQERHGDGRWNVFEIPRDVLESLRLRRLEHQTDEEQAELSTDQTDAQSRDRPEGDGGAIEKRLKASSESCSFCGGISLTSIDDRRQHVKTDWHRYNVKRRLQHGKSVSEEAFNAIIEQLEESLSGSDSESSSNAESHSGSEEGEREERARKTFAASPLAWFQVDQKVSADTQLGIYKTLFPRDVPPSKYVERLSAMQLKSSDQSRDKIWTMFMTGGGHFAGMVVSLVPKRQGKERQLQILAHKTFHRYTTRRKQGGGQSANDNAKSKAKSAGAQLRRYNEQALQEDIRRILDEWSEYIDDSQLIFLRAPTRSMSTFVGYEDAVFEKDDPRLVTFPFPTRRPTLNELIRCFGELTRCKTTHFTAQELDERDQAYLDRIAPRQIMKPKIPAKSPAKARVDAETPVDAKDSEKEWIMSKMLDFIKRDKPDLLRVYLERYSTEEVNINNLTELTSGSQTTLLHYASSSGHPISLSVLLDEFHADPTLLDQSRRTAYEVASTKSCRNVFRRAMSDRPAEWSWTDARVPSPLTREMEEEQEKKAVERRRKERERAKLLKAKREEEAMRQREKEKEAKEKTVASRAKEAKVQPFPSLSRVPNSTSAKSSSTLDQLTLTPEQRLRIERERRARAAEARMQR